MGREGFTLAEILITLGIIGVVSALTIPTLFISYQNSQYVIGLKKAYNETNQALKQMTEDNGCVNDFKCTGLFAAGKNDQTLGDELVKYLKIAKNCGTEPGLTCWASKTNKFYDGTSAQSDPNDDSDCYKFITASGMSYCIRNDSDDCSLDRSMNVLGTMTQVCGYVWIDLNGPKRPNNAGRDTFYFWITNGKGALLYPYGGEDTNTWWNYNNNSNNCASSGGNKWGMACTGRVMEEGWQMNY